MTLVNRTATLTSIKLYSLSSVGILALYRSMGYVMGVKLMGQCKHWIQHVGEGGGSFSSVDAGSSACSGWSRTVPHVAPAL